MTKAQRQALKGKGQGRGKGKGKKGSRDTGCAAETPDGKRVCYSFNNKQEPCTRKKCQFLHVCGKCFKDHPMWSPQCSA